MTTHYLDDPDNRCGGKNCDGSCCKPVDYKALWEQMCERCDYLDKIAAQLQALCDMQALRLGKLEEKVPQTPEHQSIDKRVKVKLGGQYGFFLDGNWFYLQPADEFANAALYKHTGVDHDTR